MSIFINQYKGKSKNISTYLFLAGTATLVLNQVRVPIITFSITNIFFLLSGFFVLVEFLLYKGQNRKLIPNHPLFFPTYLILLGGILSSMLAINTPSSLSVTMKEVFIFSIWFSIGIRVVVEGYGRTIERFLIIGALLTSVIAILDFAFGTSIGPFLLSRSFSNDYEASLAYRDGGLMGHPNEQGMFLAVIFPLILNKLLFPIKIVPYKYLFASILLMIVLAAAAISGSVSGYLGILISGLVMIIFSIFTKGKKFPLIILILTCALLFIISNAFLSFLPEDAIIRISRRNDLGRVFDVTGPERKDIMMEGIEVIKRSPIIGVGMDQSGTGDLERENLSTSHYIHNTILQSWVAGGLFAFLGTLLIYANTISIAFKGIKYAISKNLPNIICYSASIFGFILMDMAQPNIYQRFKWLIVIIIIGILYKGSNVQTTD
jgi:hypothetical protein